MFSLVCYPETPQAKHHWLQADSINYIGRSQENEICIIDSSVSRQHAEITVKGNQITIKDLGSRNGTYLNGQRINESRLNPGDCIRCGDIELRLLKGTQVTPPTSLVKQYLPKAANSSLSQLSRQNRVLGSIVNIPPQPNEQQTTTKLNLLLEVGQQLSALQSIEQLLERILSLLFDIFSIDRAAILLQDEQTQTLRCQAAKAQPGVSVEGEFYSQNITNQVFQTGEAVLTTNAQTDFSDTDSVLQKRIHAAVCVPLHPRDEVIGVLYVDNLSMSGIYADEDVAFLSTVANQAAIAIDNAQLAQKIAAEAVLRSKLERFFPQSVSRKLREEDSLEIIETEVTALFADISGFTQMSSTMPPREVIGMLNDYFNVIVEEIVFAYEGTLEKYIGDALFAIWGAPYSREDDTERAIKAAIEMQWAVQHLNQQWEAQGKQPIAIHIGLNTGQVAAGNIGSKNLIQYATIGDTTNVTSRICSVAEADEIMISEATLQKIKHLQLPYEQLPPVKVKGKDEPLQLYRLLWQDIPAESKDSAF
jgi:adenylate cyclase